jgi:hypothetical protein
LNFRVFHFTRWRSGEGRITTCVPTGQVKPRE